MSEVLAEGRREKPRTGVAVQDDVARHDHARRRAAPAHAASHADCDRTARRSWSPTAATGRTSRRATRRARWRRGAALHGHDGGGARAARAAEAAAGGARRSRRCEDFGADPGTGKPIVVKEGRFGPYVTDGETNASLRRGDDPEALTIDRALELLAERRAKGRQRRKRSRAEALDEDTVSRPEPGITASADCRYGSRAVRPAQELQSAPSVLTFYVR